MLAGSELADASVDLIDPHEVPGDAAPAVIATSEAALASAPGAGRLPMPAVHPRPAWGLTSG